MAAVALAAGVIRVGHCSHSQAAPCDRGHQGCQLQVQDAGMRGIQPAA